MAPSASLTCRAAELKPCSATGDRSRTTTLVLDMASPMPRPPTAQPDRRDVAAAAPPRDRGETAGDPEGDQPGAALDELVAAQRHAGPALQP